MNRKQKKLLANSRKRVYSSSFSKGCCEICDWDGDCDGSRDCDCNSSV